MQNAIVIVGYNNTRIYDIERIKNYCHRELNAEIVLCKEDISSQDKAITPYTLEVDLNKRGLDSIEGQIIIISDFLLKNKLRSIGCLPFSDKGIPLGSYFAKSHGLTHDDCIRSHACVDKYTFRCLEAEATTPPWYKKPFFKRIFTMEEAKELVNESTVTLFFKPTSEGNSRGCIEINSIEDLNNHLPILTSYFEQGILVEECIKGSDEYSFDGVDGSYVITEKKTSSGSYRVETQHIVPALLDPDHYARLLEAGKIVAAISGSQRGAVHNELFLNKKTGDVYCVEPNRRPAGLKLWDWIQHAYPDVDNWDRWLSWASGKRKLAAIPEENKYYVGCRMLQSPTTGIITAINHQAKVLLEQRPEIVEINLTKSIGAEVTSLLKDNSNFIGYIVCKHESIEDLRKLLDSISKEAILLFDIC